MDGYPAKACDRSLFEQIWYVAEMFGECLVHRISACVFPLEDWTIDGCLVPAFLPDVWFFANFV